MFNIHFSFNEIEPQLRKILRDAEKKGLVEITAEKPFAMSCDNGQILEDRKNKYHDGDIKRCMKVWEVVGFDKRESSVTLRVVEGDYHPKKRFIIPEREMMNEVDKIGHGLIRVGRFIINEKGDYGRILKMCVQEIVDKELSHNNEIRNPHRDDIMMDCIYVEYEFENDYRIDSGSLDRIKFDGTKETTLEKFIEEWNVISEQDIVKHEREMKFIEESGQISQFSDILDKLK